MTDFENGNGEQPLCETCRYYRFIPWKLNNAHWCLRSGAIHGRVDGCSTYKYKKT